MPYKENAGCGTDIQTSLLREEGRVLLKNVDGAPTVFGCEFCTSTQSFISRATCGILVDSDQIIKGLNGIEDKMQFTGTGSFW